MSTKNTGPMYLNLKPWELEPHYSKHVSAMTSEALHSKAAIAEQLAWRDQTIEVLRTELTHLRAALDSKAVVLGEESGAQQKTQAVVAAAVGWFNAPDADDDAIGHLAAHLGLINALEEGGFIPAPEDDAPASPDTVKR